MARISISIPEDLLREFDRIRGCIGYKDRSKAIQAAIRDFITQHMIGEGGEGSGAVIFIYDHTIPGLEEYISDVQHKYGDVISAAMHIHLDRKHCLQIVSVRGEWKRISNLSRKLRGRKGVKQLRVSVLGKVFG